MIRVELDPFGEGVAVLGPVGIAAPDGTMHPVAGQQGLVLALLASEHPRPVPVDVLVDELWPLSPPASAATGLRVVMNRLRERLSAIHPGVPPIVHHEHGYQLALTGDRLDHTVFMQAVATAGRGDDLGGRGSPADILATALELWRGRAFEPFCDSPRLSLVAAKLESLRCDAEETLIQALLDAGDHDRAAVLATSLVETEPYRERRWEQLMLALYRSGRQTEALRAANRVRTILIEELGIEPGPALTRLEAHILNHDPALDQRDGVDVGPGSDRVAVKEFIAILRHHPSRIPTTATSYVQPDPTPVVAAMANAGDSPPMLTIVGPPGVGKSRFAARLVAGLTDAEPATRPRRVVWLDLIDAAFDTQPEQGLRDAIAGALDIRPTGQPLTEALAEVVRQEPTVIVFDNADHRAAAVADLAEELLAACPELKMVATSRTPLAGRSEKVLVLDPLPVEAAVDLLVDRAPAGAGARYGREELAALAEKVDGLPLAIELVAPHLVSMPPTELARRLDHTLEPVSGRGRLDPRHRSMERAIDWSVDLLVDDDRDLLAPIGAMAGAFTAAELAALVARVAGGEPPQLTGDRPVAVEERVNRSLHRLAEHGLVRASDGRPGRRWTMANTTRAYVRDRSATADPGPPWSHHHAFLHLDRVGELSRSLVDDREEQAVAELRRLSPQISAAHRWFLDHGEVAASAAMSTAMWEYSFFRQDYGRYRWLGETLDLPGVDELEGYDEVLALGALAAWAQDRLMAAARLAEKAETVAIARGRPVPLASYKARLNVAVHDDRRSEAATWLDRLMAESAERGDRRHHGDNLVVAALGYSQFGFAEQARRLAEEADALASAAANPTAVAWARVALAASEVERAPERAARSYSAAARLARTVHNRWVSGMATTGLVTALRRQGRQDQARRLLIEVTGLWARARQHGLLSRAAQEAVLLLAHPGSPPSDLDRAAGIMDHLERAGHRIQLLPDDQARFDELATTLGQRAVAGAPAGTRENLGRRVIDALDR